MPTLDCRRNILYIRCADGRSRRPEDIREHCVHQIRLPGGVLNAEFKSRLTETTVSLQDLQELTLIDIRTMIALKNPDEVILASHENCGAVDALCLSHNEVVTSHYRWKAILEAEFPELPISVVHEMLPVEDESERSHIYVLPCSEDAVHAAA